MTLLVDTHILLWALTAPDRLSGGHREALEDPTNTVFASAINIVEIAIKSSIGKLTVADSLESDRYAGLLAGLKNGGVDMPAFTGVHAASVRTLPFHHRAPFDRMISAQAIAEGYAIVTADSQLTKCRHNSVERGIPHLDEAAVGSRCRLHGHVQSRQAADRLSLLIGKHLSE